MCCFWARTALGCIGQFLVNVSRFQIRLGDVDAGLSWSLPDTCVMTPLNDAVVLLPSGSQAHRKGFKLYSKTNYYCFCFFGSRIIPLAAGRDSMQSCATFVSAAFIWTLFAHTWISEQSSTALFQMMSKYSWRAWKHRGIILGNLETSLL